MRLRGLFIIVFLMIQSFILVHHLVRPADDIFYLCTLAPGITIRNGYFQRGICHRFIICLLPFTQFPADSLLFAAADKGSCQ